MVCYITTQSLYQLYHITIPYYYSHFRFDTVGCLQQSPVVVVVAGYIMVYSHSIPIHHMSCYVLLLIQETLIAHTSLIGSMLVLGESSAAAINGTCCTTGSLLPFRNQAFSQATLSQRTFMFCYTLLAILSHRPPKATDFAICFLSLNIFIYFYFLFPIIQYCLNVRWQPGAKMCQAAALSAFWDATWQGCLTLLPCGSPRPSGSQVPWSTRYPSTKKINQ